MSRLLGKFPEYLDSFEKASALVGGFLLETRKIFDQNRTNHGEEAIKFYWNQVAKFRMKNDQLKEKIQLMELKEETVDSYTTRRVMTEEQIYNKAANKTNRKFNKDNKKPKFESILDPDRYDPVSGSRIFETAQQKIKREVKDIGGGSKKKTILRKFFDKKSGDNTRYVRAQGMVGAVFGAADSSSTNWWRRRMSDMVLFAQVGGGLKDTVYSHVPILQTLSKFADSTKLHTGHLVGAGKRPIKTWMQSDSLVKRRMGRLTQRNAQILKFSRKAYPHIMEYIYTSRASKEPITKEGLLKAIDGSDLKKDKIPAFVEMVLPAVENYNKELTDIYRTIFDLQEETGWKFINEIEGAKQLDPETYVPITLDPNKLDQDLKTAVEQMSIARRETIKQRDTLHTSLVYALGWLPTTFESRDPASALFSKARDIDGKAIKNNAALLQRVVESQFDSQTIDNLTLLRTFDNPLDAVGANEKLYGKLAKNWFVIKQGDEYVIVKMPSKLDELSATDRAKYNKALDGNVTDYVPNILDIINRTKNRDIIEAEMSELISFKLGRGVYGSGVKAGLNYRPILGLADPNKRGVGVYIQNITPEEIQANPGLKSYMQTNATMSTLDFMNGRMFELHAQRELDRMLGSKGVRMYDFLKEAEAIAIQRIEEEGHSPKETDMLIKSVRHGIEKLQEQYSMYSQHLSRIEDNYSDFSVHAGTLSKNLLTSTVGSGFGLLATAETILTVAGRGVDNVLHPSMIIKDTATLLRNVFGDLRYDRAADRIEVADTIFAFDLLNRNHSARMLSELDESIELTTSLKERMFGPADAGIPENINSGVGGFVQRGVGRMAYFTREVGSLQQVTNANRMIAIPKYTRMVIKVLKNDKIDSFLTALESPEVKKKLKKLEKEASTDRSKQAELVKYIKSLAREEGGMDYQTVSAMLQYGLMNRESVDALRLAFEESGIKVDNGRIDFMELNTFVMDLRSNRRKVDGLDPNVLEEALDSLAYMVEQLVTTREVTEQQGLAKPTSKLFRNPIGQLVNSLFGWVNSFHYNVITNYGNRTSLKYAMGTLMMVAVSNAVAMTFREWLRGRDGEDILKEMEEDPMRFIALAIQGVPMIGRFNSIVDAGVAGIQMMMGSEPRHVFSPVGVPGLEAPGKVYTDISRAFSKSANFVTGENDASGIDVAAAMTKATQVDGFINNSPLAIPVRVLESAEVIKQGTALREYLDSIQFNETPYQDAVKRNRYRKNLYSLEGLEKEGLQANVERVTKEKDRLKQYLNTTPISSRDRMKQIQRDFSIESGDYFRSPRENEMTPEPPQTVEALSGPSKASQNLADVLQKKQKK